MTQEIPKLVPINMMQIRHSSGALHITYGGKKTVEESESPIDHLKQVLKESGKDRLRVRNNKSSSQSGASYALTISYSGLSLLQRNTSQRVCSEYSFETGALLFNDRPASKEDLMIFARVIQKISSDIQMKKASVGGAYHA
jgi:hypothetical protein